MEKKIIMRPIPYIKYHNEWFNANKIAEGLDQLLSDSPEGSDVGNALSNYEIKLNNKFLKMLVEDGLVTTEVGEKFSNRYWIAEGKTDEITQMFKEIREFIIDAKDSD